MDQSPNLLAAGKALEEGRWKDAEVEATRELDKDPHQALSILAKALIKQGNTERAAKALADILAQWPEDRFALQGRASMTWNAGEYQNCAVFCSRLLAIDPENPTFWNSQGMCFASLDSLGQAIISFEEAVRLDPAGKAFRRNLVRALGLHADELFSVERTAEANELNQRLLQLEPNDREALLMQAKLLQRFGDHDQADIVLNSVAELNPAYTPTFGLKARGKKMVDSDRPFVEQMEELLQKKGLSKSELTDLHFALGKSYDDLGEYELAMKHFDQANAVQKGQMKETFDKQKLLASFEYVRQSYESGLVKQLGAVASDSEAPLFVIGINRSGTTLVEQILSSHPLIEGGGEIEFWSVNASKTLNRKLNQVNTEETQRLSAEYLALLHKIGKGKPRVTDKQNANYQYVGLLHTLYPNARFVVCRRDPIDNCLSIYMTYFSTNASFFHDKDNIAFTYRQYQSLLDYWKKVIPQDRLFEVQYEELVDNPESITQDLIAFVGLEWNQACLHPEQNRRSVSTASQWQVRQPIYKSSVARWRRYEPWLGGLADLVEQDS